jgi:hypothetical protein
VDPLRAWALPCAFAVALGEPAPSAEDETGKKRLKLDIDKRVEAALERDADTPRFEEQVDVEGRTPEELLARFTEGADLDCEPAGVGAPTEYEMREVRPGPSPYLDFLALGSALLAHRRRKGPDRYFVYRVSRGASVSYVLREGEAGKGFELGPGGATLELVASFPDRERALRRFRRLERGQTGPETDASPPPPFLATNCRPGRN